MDRLYDQALGHMERIANDLARRVPQPRRIPYKGGFVFRYAEKTVRQALIQKLARLVSTLHATRLLMEQGFVQEQASLQRVLDEILEDISFLAYGVIFKEETELHRAYLDAFYEEEFDADTALASTQRRAMTPRKKIRAYIARMDGAAVAVPQGAEAARTISKAYSGFVHAASPQIMDMYGGNPPRFHMRGMWGTTLHDDHRDDLWNYFYRGIIAFAFSAKAFGDDDLFGQIQAFVREFIRQSGKDYSIDK